MCIFSLHMKFIKFCAQCRTWKYKNKRFKKLFKEMRPVLRHGCLKCLCSNDEIVHNNV